LSLLVAADVGILPASTAAFAPDCGSHRSSPRLWRDDFADNRFDDRLFAGKNTIQLTNAQARLAGNIGNGSAMQPLFSKTPLRSGNDLARRACCFC
jgi:hypothetical protein